MNNKDRDISEYTTAILDARKALREVYPNLIIVNWSDTMVGFLMDEELMEILNKSKAYLDEMG